MSGTGLRRCSRTDHRGRQCPRPVMAGSDQCYLHRLASLQGFGAALAFLAIVLLPLINGLKGLGPEPLRPTEVPVLRFSHLVAYEDYTLDLMQQGRLAEACALTTPPKIMGNEVSQWWQRLYANVWVEVEHAGPDETGRLPPSWVHKARLGSPGWAAVHYSLGECSDLQGEEVAETYRKGAGSQGFYGWSETFRCAAFRMLPASRLTTEVVRDKDPLTWAVAKANPNVDDLLRAEPEGDCADDEPQYESFHCRPMRMVFLRVENLGGAAASDMRLRARKLTVADDALLKLRTTEQNEAEIGAVQEVEVEWKSLAPGEQLLIPLETYLGDVDPEDWSSEGELEAPQGDGPPDWTMTNLRYEDAKDGELIAESAEARVRATPTYPGVCSRYYFGPAWRVSDVTFTVPNNRSQTCRVPPLDECRLARVSEYAAEGGCCPLVTAAGMREFHVLDRAGSPERERFEVHPLLAGTSQVVLREKLDEESFLDLVWLLVRTPAGKTIRIRPKLPELAENDGVRYRIGPGQRLVLDFPASTIGVQATSLKVKGFYRKLPQRPATIALRE